MDVERIYKNLQQSSTPELAQKAALKKIKVELELSTGIDMLLMVEKGVKEGYGTLLIVMKKLMINISKIMIRIKIIIS